MINQWLFLVFLLIGTINLIHLALYIGGANLYDIWQFRRAKKMPKRIRGDRPLVSVIIPAHNEETVIERCLDSVRSNTYRKVEVIVHNDHSSDDTAKVVRAYQQAYPKFNLRLISRRHQVGKASGLNYAIKRYAKGSLIMALDADSMLQRRAIMRTSLYFRDEKVAGVAANVRLMDEPTILGLLQKFEHMAGYRSKKFYSMTNSEYIIGGVASTYRSDIMHQVNLYDTDTMTEDIGLSMKVVELGNRRNKIVYAADVVAMTEGVQTFKQLLAQRYRWKMGGLQNLLKHRSLIGNIRRRYSLALTLYRLPMAFLGEIIMLLQPLVLVYAFILSVVYQTPQLFLGAYMVITLYVMWTIWPDEHSPLTKKLSLSLYAPIMYFIFYIMDAVQVFSIIKCLFNPSQLMRRTNSESWVSPQRRGQIIGQVT